MEALGAGAKARKELVWKRKEKGTTTAREGPEHDTHRAQNLPPETAPLFFFFWPEKKSVEPVQIGLNVHETTTHRCATYSVPNGPSPGLLPLLP
jgi:hypothetical protein